MFFGATEVTLALNGWLMTDQSRVMITRVRFIGSAKSSSVSVPMFFTRAVIFWVEVGVVFVVGDGGDIVCAIFE